MDIHTLLNFALEKQASDLHLSAGLPPMLRLDGALCQINASPLEDKSVIKMIHEIMNDKQRVLYTKNLELDFSFTIAHQARFRVNAFRQARGAGAVFRLIPPKIPTFTDLNLPPIFTHLASFSQGLVLVTGAAGVGKSTTLAAMIDYINTHRSGHILTIEDPLEFVHESKKCLITQREVQQDTLSFNAALRSALRQDPDVILVGELRDLETMRLAITAAETGHLVFATLHTRSAPQTINRMIDVFPREEKSIMRSMLSDSLQAVIGQSLLKKIEGGRLAAWEIMICNPAIRNLIREDKVAQMYSVMQTSQAQGMITLDQQLLRLVQDKMIAPHDAWEAAVTKSLFAEFKW